MDSSLHWFLSAPLPDESDAESVVEEIPHITETPSGQVDDELKDAVKDEDEDEEDDDEGDEDTEMSVQAQ